MSLATSLAGKYCYRGRAWDQDVIAAINEAIERCAKIAEKMEHADVAEKIRALK